MFNVSPRTLVTLQDAGYSFLPVSNKKRANKLALLKVSLGYSRVLKLVRPK